MVQPLCARITVCSPVLPGWREIGDAEDVLVQIYLDAVTHQVITNEELAYVAGNQDRFIAQN